MISVATMTKLLERAARPGLQGVAGMALEKRCASDLDRYFSALAAKINAAELDKVMLADPLHAVHAIDMKLHNILRLTSTTLMSVLAVNIHNGYLLGLKQGIFHESKVTPSMGYLDKVGPTAMDAADYAATKSAALVTQINDTTRKIIQDAIAQGFDEQMSPVEVGRLIRKTVDDMSVYRGKMIARTEMADSISQATMDKMKAENVLYKQVVLSDDPCEVCLDNADADPLPIDELYPSGDMRAPFHPNCRCATTGARPPEGE